MSLSSSFGESCILDDIINAIESFSSEDDLSESESSEPEGEETKYNNLLISVVSDYSSRTKNPTVDEGCMSRPQR